MLEEHTESTLELKRCYYVRTVLMILIVFYHSIVFWSSADWFVIAPLGNSKLLGACADLLNSFHIYTFVLVSGFVYYALRFEEHRYIQFIPFAIGKVKRLIIPYIATLIIIVIPVSTQT
jgi:fucose 4-O-acetylase-like acetyltransferase